MTCIIGLEENGKAYLGADSAGTAGMQQWTSLVPKLFINGDFTIGYTSSYRMGQILQFANFPKPEDGVYSEKYMVTQFVEFIRGEFKDKAYSIIKENQETGGFFIVGVSNRVFYIESDYQVQIHADGIYTTGCGEEFARGAMMALKELPPKERILKSLEISAEASAGVAPPFHFLEVKKNG